MHPLDSIIQKNNGDTVIVYKILLLNNTFFAGGGGVMYYKCLTLRFFSLPPLVGESTGLGRKCYLSVLVNLMDFILCSGDNNL